MKNGKWLKSFTVLFLALTLFFVFQIRKSYAAGFEVVTPIIVTPQRVSLSRVTLQTVQMQIVTPTIVTLSPVSMQDVSLETITPEIITPEVIVGEKVNVQSLADVNLNNLYVPEAQNQWNAVSFASLSRKLMAPFGIKGLVSDPLMAKLFPGLQRHEEEVALRTLSLPFILYSIDNHFKAQG